MTKCLELRTVCSVILAFEIYSKLFLIPAHVELPASLLTPPNPQGNSPNPSNTNNPSATILAKDTKKKYHLNAKTDPLFGELRDLNFSSVGKTLNKNARRLEEDYKVLVLYSGAINIEIQIPYSEQASGENRCSTPGFRREIKWPAG